MGLTPIVNPIHFPALVLISTLDLDKKNRVVEQA